ncbi:MAG: hypothetical protein M1814_003316 [Vezdaea aestivalis]|nr:MAG: hypothetical protein M1814_003316 [Vezdaea aestivalis]
MPIYKAITVTLISQYDVKPIPEFPASASTTPTKSTKTVYIPARPASQFWIYYNVAQPIPPKQIFYFKLFLNGKHATSWGVGKDENWTGKTMFAVQPIRAGSTGSSDREAWDKMAFCFGDKQMDALIEMRVYRARSRTAIPLSEAVKRGGFVKKDGKKSKLHQRSSGKADQERPLMYYNYHLQDSLNSPFAKFQFQVRSWEALEELGVIPEDFQRSEAQVAATPDDQESVDIGSASQDSSRDSTDGGDAWPLSDCPSQIPKERSLLGSIDLKKMVASIKTEHKDSGKPSSTGSKRLIWDEPTSCGEGSQSRTDEVKPRHRIPIEAETYEDSSSLNDLARRASKRFSWAGALNWNREKRFLGRSKSRAAAAVAARLQKGGGSKEWLRRTPSPVKLDLIREREKLHSPGLGADGGPTDDMANGERDEIAVNKLILEEAIGMALSNDIGGTDEVENNGDSPH